jgi:hypothetical protein
MTTFLNAAILLKKDAYKSRPIGLNERCSMDAVYRSIAVTDENKFQCCSIGGVAQRRRRVRMRRTNHGHVR